LLDLSDMAEVLGWPRQPGGSCGSDSDCGRPRIDAQGA